MFLRFLIPLGLAALCCAQQPTPAPSRIIKVNVIAGQGAVNNVVVGVAAQPVVEVLDAQNAPVADAEVTFTAPSDGPSGSFSGNRTLTVKTDAKGRALATGFTPNSQIGKFQILVKAVSAGATGETSLTQSNGGPGIGEGQTIQASRKKLWTVLAIVAGGAVGGGIAASRGGSSTAAAAATKRPVTIGAGPITVGGPR